MGIINNVSFEKKMEANDSFDYGITFEMKGEFDKAENAFLKALEIDPAFAEAYNKLGDVCMKKGKFIDAIENYKKSIELKPDVENSHYDLGCAYLRLGQYEDALAELKNSLKLDPNHFEIYAQIGCIYVEKGEYFNALECFKKAIADDPTNVMARYYNGLALKMAGKLKEASYEFQSVIERYSGLIKIKKNYAEGYYFIGLSYYQLDNMKEAEVNVKKAIELDTDKIDYHFSFGLYYSDGDSFFAMAQIKKAQGDSAAAREYIEKALKFDPENKKFKSFSY
ncbi:MAG: tetratricopeptide repeat protein [Candidatus Wallbacteria bacterium]